MYLLFKLALPFSLHRIFLRLIQPFQAFLRLHQYSETFLCTFSTPVHTHSLPRPRDAVSIDENWTLIERRVRHLERTVVDTYLLGYHTVYYAECPKPLSHEPPVKNELAPVLSLQWCHNERDGFSNPDCLPNRCSCADQRKHQSSTSLTSVRTIHQWPVNSPHKGPVTMEIISIC